jgi:hypothetical protein
MARRRVCSGRPVGRPAGLPISTDLRNDAVRFIERLADDSINYEYKIHELRTEPLQQRLARNYLLASETYSCMICNHIRNAPASSWRKHIGTAEHLNAEIALLRGTYH